MIAYRKAYEAYKKYQVNYGTPMPEMLKHDLLRLAQRQGLKDEVAQYSKEFGIELQQDKEQPPGQNGELVFIFNNGLAPIKREKVIAAWAPPAGVVVGKPTPKGSGTPPMPVMVKIALPYYESRKDIVKSARISVSDKQADTELMENVDAIARASLDARMPAITARSIARAVAKGAIQQSVDRAGNNNDAAAQLISSFVVRVASAATERADTRSWLTLPSNIQMARLPLPEGNYDVTVELLGEGDRVIATQVFPQVSIHERHKTYLTQHWVPDYPSTRRRQ